MASCLERKALNFFKSFPVFLVTLRCYQSQVYKHCIDDHLPAQPRSQGLSSSRPMVGAGHVSPAEKLDPGRGPSPASLCQDLLSTPKRGFRFAARSPCETHSTGYVFQ